MGLQLLVTGTICLLVTIWCLARGIKQLRARSTPKSITYSDPAACAKILACTGYDNKETKNLYSNIKSRAIPNQRIVRAFEIDNSFTTSDVKRHREFKLEAGNAIKMTESKWQDVADHAKELICQAVSPSNLTSIPLDSLVRSVCLKIALHVLFNMNPLKMDSEMISTITESINVLWIQSKGKETPSKSEQKFLKEALTKLLPEMDHSNPHQNPLNLINPAYETLWRVVLSGFLQVTFVNGANPVLRSALAHFLANPTVKARTELVHGSEEPALSVDHIVKEILRLYPSVKRVYRQFHMDNKSKPEDVAADIEACQRTEALWGPDAQRFVPSRWITVSNEAQNSYMAFGLSPFICPAKGEYGPMMIGILVAAFAHHVSSENWYLKLGKDSSDVAQRDLDKTLSGEVPLVSDRSTYEGIQVIRKDHAGVSTGSDKSKQSPIV